MHQLSRNLYSDDDFVNIQRDLLKSMNFFLHPPTCSSFIHCFTELLVKYGDDNCSDLLLCPSNRNYRCPDDKVHGVYSSIYYEQSNRDCTCLELHDIPDINKFANMQTELAIFDMSLAMTKPSILAFCALQNAIIQHSCNYIENNHCNDDDTEQFYLLTKRIQEKIHHLNFAIGEKFLELKNGVVSEIVSIRKKLLKLWKENNPDIVTFDNSMFVGGCCQATASAIVLQIRGRHMFIPTATTNHLFIPLETTSQRNTSSTSRTEVHSTNHDIVDLTGSKCKRLVVSNIEGTVPQRVDHWDEKSHDALLLSPTCVNK